MIETIKRFWKVIVLIVLVVSIPIGVYLVSRTQIFKSRATNEEAVIFTGNGVTNQGNGQFVTTSLDGVRIKLTSPTKTIEPDTTGKYGVSQPGLNDLHVLNLPNPPLFSYGIGSYDNGTYKGNIHTFHYTPANDNGTDNGQDIGGVDDWDDNYIKAHPNEWWMVHNEPEIAGAQGTGNYWYLTPEQLARAYHKIYNLLLTRAFNGDRSKFHMVFPGMGTNSDNWRTYIPDVLTAWHSHSNWGDMPIDAWTYHVYPGGQSCQLQSDYDAGFNYTKSATMNFINAINSVDGGKYAQTPIWLTEWGWIRNHQIPNDLNTPIINSPCVSNYIYDVMKFLDTDPTAKTRITRAFNFAAYIQIGDPQYPWTDPDYDHCQVDANLESCQAFRTAHPDWPVWSGWLTKDNQLTDPGKMYSCIARRDPNSCPHLSGQNLLRADMQNKSLESTYSQNVQEITEPGTYTLTGTVQANPVVPNNPTQAIIAADIYDLSDHYITSHGLNETFTLPQGQKAAVLLRVINSRATFSNVSLVKQAGTSAVQGVKIAQVSTSSVSVSATPAQVNAGGSLTFSWQNIPNPNNRDWFGVILANAPTDPQSDAARGTVLGGFLNCGLGPESPQNPPPSSPVPSGSCSIPLLVNPGTYVIRLYSAGSWNILAQTDQFTVASSTSPAPAPPQNLLRADMQNKSLESTYSQNVQEITEPGTYTLTGTVQANPVVPNNPTQAIIAADIYDLSDHYITSHGLNETFTLPQGQKAAVLLRVINSRATFSNVSLVKTIPVDLSVFPPLTPPPSPATITATSFKVAKNPADLSSAPSQPYSNNPSFVDFNFSTDTNPNTAKSETAFVEFIFSNGQTERHQATITYQPSTSTPPPTSTPPQTNTGEGKYGIAQPEFNDLNALNLPNPPLFDYGTNTPHLSVNRYWLNNPADVANIHTFHYTPANDNRTDNGQDISGVDGWDEAYIKAHSNEWWTLMNEPEISDNAYFYLTPDQFARGYHKIYNLLDRLRRDTTNTSNPFTFHIVFPGVGTNAASAQCRSGCYPTYIPAVLQAWQSHGWGEMPIEAWEFHVYPGYNNCELPNEYTAGMNNTIAHINSFISFINGLGGNYASAPLWLTEWGMGWNHQEPANYTTIMANTPCVSRYIYDVMRFLETDASAKTRITKVLYFGAYARLDSDPYSDPNYTIPNVREVHPDWPAWSGWLTEVAPLTNPARTFSCYGNNDRNMCPLLPLSDPGKMYSCIARRDQNACPYSVDLSVFPPLTSISSNSVNAGGQITFSWHNIPNPNTRDWFGVILANAPTDPSNEAARETVLGGFLNCGLGPESSQNPPPSSPIPSGSCSVSVPANFTPGNYVIRLYSSGSWNILAQSSQFSVTPFVAGRGGGGSQQESAPSSSISVSKTASFSLQANNSYALSQTIPVKVMMQSDTDPANTFVAKIKFPKDLMTVSRIDTSGSFIGNWVENNFDNNAGIISLAGGVPNPGYKTSGSSALMATVYFTPKKTGVASLAFDASSSIFRNSDNASILGSTLPASITITPAAVTTSTPVPTTTPSAPSPSSAPVIPTVTSAPTTAPTPASFPSLTDQALRVLADSLKNIPLISSLIPTPAPTPAPVYETGDLNHDGNVNFVDLSLLLSNWGKTKTQFSNPSVDVNGDGVINSFDFSELRQTLIDNKIIQGK